MKKVISILIVFLVSFVTKVSASNSNSDIKTALINVNAEWKKHSEYDSLINSIKPQCKNYEDWITIHLMLVEEILKQKKASELNFSQERKRKNLLQNLNQYWKEGVFPLNNFTSRKAPVFIDEKGTHCAVGYLMKMSGAETLAKKINSSERFAFVKDIKTKGVKEWAAKNGFTLDELAWIQPTYMPNTTFDKVEQSSNGEIDLIFDDQAYNKLIITGSFDTLNNYPCSKIGYYRKNQLKCFGEGIQGTVNGVISYPYLAYATGSFYDSNQYYPIAYYDTDSVWKYDSIASRPNAIGKCIFYGGSGYTAEFAIQVDSLAKNQEIWYKMNSGLWQKQATVNGCIKQINASSLGRIYAGSFDSVIVHRNGFGDTLILAKNAIIKENYGSNWFGIGTALSDTILCVKVIGSIIYLSGTCSSDSGKSTVCMCRYLNGVLQPLIESDNFNGSKSYSSINDFESYDGSSLIIGGNFYVIPFGIGTYTKNIAKYDAVNGYINDFGFLNNTVTSISKYQNELFIGGKFMVNQNDTITSFAKLRVYNYIDDNDDNLSAKIYPNPSKDFIQIEMPFSAKAESIQISDVAGSNVSDFSVNNDFPKISISDLSSGIYILSVKTTNKYYRTKFVKE